MIPFLQAVAGGVLLGGLYALVGAGLTLAVGVTRVASLAHGALVMLGMYAAWILSARLGWDPYLSVLAAAPLLFLLGALVHLAARGPARAAPPQDRVLLTAGLGLILAGAVALGFTPDRHALTTAYTSARLDLGGLSLPQPLLLSSLAALALTALLHAFLHRTDAGRAVRATVEDRTAARLMGIDVRRTSLLAAALGAALAGAAGALLAPLRPVSPQAGGGLALTALAVVALGGVGSVPGAAAAGLGVGLAEALAQAYLADGTAEAVACVLLLAVLLARPSRLLGRASREGA